MTCPYVVTTDEGTSYCKLAQQDVGELIKQAKREAYEEAAKLIDESQVLKEAGTEWEWIKCTKVPAQLAAEIRKLKELE